MWLTLPIDIVIWEIAIVGVSISPLEESRSLLPSFDEDSLEFRAIWPALGSLTMLGVIFPEASVELPIRVEVVSKAVCFVILPLTLVDVAIFVEEATQEWGLIILPIALIKAAISPHLQAPAFPDLRPLPPFTKVSWAVWHADQGTVLALRKLHLLFFSSVCKVKRAVLVQHFLTDQYYTHVRIIENLPPYVLPWQMQCLALKGHLGLFCYRGWLFCA